jgi:hypothetical protein
MNQLILILVVLVVAYLYMNPNQLSQLGQMPELNLEGQVCLSKMTLVYVAIGLVVGYCLFFRNVENFEEIIPKYKYTVIKAMEDFNVKNPTDAFPAEDIALIRSSCNCEVIGNNIKQLSTKYYGVDAKKINFLYNELYNSVGSVCRNDFYFSPAAFPEGDPCRVDPKTIIR